MGEMSVTFGTWQMLRSNHAQVHIASALSHKYRSIANALEAQTKVQFAENMISHRAF
jgi:hypothetical protein